jgi:hypothetical protein
MKPSAKAGQKLKQARRFDRTNDDPSAPVRARSGRALGTFLIHAVALTSG